MSGSCWKEFGNLVTQHAYTLVGVAELKKDGKTYKRLFKMRNPWGKEQYNGPWNDEDPQWTADFKQQVSLSVDKSDGVFYMPVEDYPKAFSDIIVVHYKDWQKKQMDVSVDKDLTYVIDNTQVQDVAVGVDTYTERMFPKGCPAHDNYYYLYLDDQDSNTVIQKSYISLQYGFGNVLVKNLAVGKYKVTIKKYGDGTDARDMTITTFGAKSSLEILNVEKPEKSIIDEINRAPSDKVTSNASDDGTVKSKAYLNDKK